VSIFVIKKHLSQPSTCGYILTLGEFFLLDELIKPRLSNIKIMFGQKNNEVENNDRRIGNRGI